MRSLAFIINNITRPFTTKEAQYHLSVSYNESSVVVVLWLSRSNKINIKLPQLSDLHNFTNKTLAFIMPPEYICTKQHQK